MTIRENEHIVGEIVWWIFFAYLIMEGNLDSGMKMVSWILAALMGVGTILWVWVGVREARAAKALKMASVPEMKVKEIEEDLYSLRDLGQMMKGSPIEIRIRSKEDGFNVTFLETGKMRKMVAAGSGGTVSEALLQAESSFMEKEDI